MSVWFLLREIELSFTRLHKAHVKVEEGRVTWRLPVSKRDPAGKGATRVWRCMCGQHLGASIGQVTARICPVCTMCRQIRYAEVYQGVKQEEDAAHELPLFPNDGGDDFTKKQVVAGWREAVGKRLPDGADAPPISGHTARRTGAHLLARLRWARWQIQYMSRHSSSQIDLYVGEAYNEQADDWGDDAQRATRDANISELRTMLADLSQDVVGLKSAAMAPTAGEALRGRDRDDKHKTQFLSVGSSKIHVVPSGHATGPRCDWRTLCRRRVAAQGRLVWHAEPEGHDKLCKRCRDLLELAL